jgi:hypothetical protein
MALSATQIQKLIEDDGYPAMIEMYDSVPSLYQDIAEVLNTNDAGMPLYGDKGTTFQGMDEFREREDGAEFEDSTINEVHTWQCKIRQYGRALIIPSRVLLANDLSAAQSLIQQAAPGFGEQAKRQKDDFVAGMFQKGTLTAGSLPYFDNTFAKNTDPNRGFIYDGLPWFDTAHALSDGSGSYSNHSASLALTEANLETVLIAMTDTNAVDDRGNRVSITPTHLLVPAGLQFTAQKILRSVSLPGTANNDINPLFNSVIPVTWRALRDSSSAWWVIQAKKGLRVYDSGVPRLRQYTLQNGDLAIMPEYLFGAAVTNWRFHYCANKAAS